MDVVLHYDRHHSPPPSVGGREGGREDGTVHCGHAVDG